MKLILRMSLLVGMALFHTSCATPLVTRHDTLDSQTPKGFVEFYIGASGLASVPKQFTCVDVLAPDSLLKQNNLLKQTTGQVEPWWIRFGLFNRTPFTHEAQSQPVSYGSIQARAFGGSRLRIACVPGTNTFLLAKNNNKAFDSSDRLMMVTVDVMEQMVTPVRVMLNYLSVTNRGNLKEYDVLWTVATGKPQQVYDPVSSAYLYKDGIHAMGIANTVSTVVVECKNAQELQDIKRRLDQAHMGLNLGILTDRSEFVKRYHQSSQKDATPQGVMISITTQHGFQYLPAIVLTE